jgi:chorismate synthase
MPGNVFGTEFRITTFGESHGKAVGVVIEGVTPGLELLESDIQQELDRRKPGQSEITTSRKESDTVHIVSGVFESKAIGTPLTMIIFNEDADSKSYENIKSLFRPGHADYTYYKKYGIRDYRGGGRSSGRETIARVAAGAVAKKMLSKTGIKINAYVIKAARIECKERDMSAIEKNIVKACDETAAKAIVEKILKLKEEGNSAGGIVECKISGVPADLGEPVFDKLDADIAKAMLSIGSVKGIEFGLGFKSADITGKENNDQMDKNGFLSNNSGGILGGISTGQEILFRIAVKPTASIASEQKTIDINGNEVVCKIEGRHDPCICSRIVPVVEAMAAIVIVDHIKRVGKLYDFSHTRERVD